MTKLPIYAAFALATAGNTFGYGNDGHQAVGTIAERHLEGTHALEMAHSLLKKGDGLDRASTWLDRAKLPDKYLSTEMTDFIANNPDHHSFHYCDIPFQQNAYREGLTGTNQHDIVHIMEICIKVLQAPNDDSANPLKINKRLALMMLTHLVGDLHQPLHVGCSYVDGENHFVDPETGAKGLPDAGGNFFHINTRKGKALHAYWDNLTVKDAGDHLGIEDFPAALMKANPPKPEWNAKGDVVTWPAQWATDTLSLSATCFEGLQPHDRFLVPKDEKHEEHFEWIVNLPAGYQEKSRDTVELELSKAGYRLAMLLKTIWPDEK